MQRCYFSFVVQNTEHESRKELAQELLGSQLPAVNIPHKTCGRTVKVAAPSVCGHEGGWASSRYPAALL